MPVTKMAWICMQCQELKFSYSNERHKMDTCECGKSSVDLEEGYCRIVGNALALATQKEGEEWEWIQQKEK